MTSPDDALIEPDELDPAASAATAHFGPPPSSETPGHVQEPPGRSGSEKQRPDEEPAPPVAFDERCKEPFTGLLYLGALTDRFSVWGHQFVIATPSQAEKLQIGLLLAPYAETMASEIAYQTIQVAAFLVSVDDTDLPKPVLNDQKENAVRDRFIWVGENLRQPVIDEIFGRCMILEGQVREVLKAMGEARG